MATVDLAGALKRPPLACPPWPGLGRGRLFPGDSQSWLFSVTAAQAPGCVTRRPGHGSRGRGASVGSWETRPGVTSRRECGEFSGSQPLDSQLVPKEMRRRTRRFFRCLKRTVSTFMGGTPGVLGGEPRPRMPTRKPSPSGCKALGSSPSTTS